jgi:ankyrin repeat protein
MNTTLQPYLQPELANLSKTIALASKANNLANYTAQLDLITNRVLPMLAKAEDRYGNNSTKNNKFKVKPLLHDLKQNKSENITAEHRNTYIHREQAILNCLPQMGKANGVIANNRVLDNKRLYEARINSSDINAQNQQGITRLMVASATTFSLEYVINLLNNGTKIDLQDQEGNTALIWAIKSLALVSQQYREKLHYLKKWKSASELWINGAMSTDRARENPSEHREKTLKEARDKTFEEVKINIDLFPTQRKDKAILQIINTLIGRGASVTLTGTGGFSSVMLAVIGNELTLLEKLLKNKANADLQNDAGETALHLAVKYKTCWRIVESLLLYATDINKKNKKGQTSFMLAVQRGKWDIIAILLAKGVDLTETDTLGWTVLMHAVNCGELKMVDYLLKRGADVGFMNADNITALLIAEENKDNDIIELLNTHLSDLSSRTPQQATLTTQSILPTLTPARDSDDNKRRKRTEDHIAPTFQHNVTRKKKHNANKRHAPEEKRSNFHESLIWHDIIKSHIRKLTASNNKVKNPFIDQTRQSCLQTVNGAKNIAVSAIELEKNYINFCAEIGNSSNAQNHDGISDLMMQAATSYSNAGFVKPMIKNDGADVNLRDNENNTALMWAVKSFLEMNEEKERNKHQLQKLTLGKVNHKDYYLRFRPEEEQPQGLRCDDIICDETACEEDIFDVAKPKRLFGKAKIAANNALLNIIDKSFKLDNLHCTDMSCEESYMAVLNSDTSEYRKTPCGETDRSDDPLHEINCHLAVKKEIIGSLLDNGADSDLTGTEGFSPLMMTVIKNDLSTFMQLIARGANSELTNNKGETALHLAIKYSTDQNIINLLIVLAKNINVKDNNNQTPFMIASFRGKQDVMELLIQKGADMNQADHQGWTALMHGINCNNEKIVKYLIDKGAEINFHTSCSKSALMIALEKRNKNMAQLLFTAGANIKAEERDYFESLTIKNIHKGSAALDSETSKENKDQSTGQTFTADHNQTMTD